MFGFVSSIFCSIKLQQTYEFQNDTFSTTNNFTLYLALVKGILHNKIYWFSSGLKFNIREKSNENLKFHQKI